MAKLSITWLRNVSLVYLFSPFFIFLFGWLHLWLAIVVAALLLYPLFNWMRSPLYGVLVLNRRQLIWLLGLSGLWTVLAFPLSWQPGGPCEALLYDLVHKPWPVTYFGHNLSYATAFFLVPALAGKTAGFALAVPVAWLWSFTGICLVLLWWVHFTGRQWIVPISLLFIFASGLDALGYPWGTATVFSPDHIENAIAGQWTYASQATLLAYMPQHALAGWLGAALILQKEPWLQKLLLLPVIALWSAYAAIGLLLWWLCLARWPIPGDQRMPRLIRILVLAASVFTGIVMISYLTDFIQPIRWEWTLQTLNDAGLYILFITAEILLWLPVLFYITPLSAYERRMQVCLLVLLLVVPLVKTGLDNNLGTLLSIPLLWIFWLWFSRGVRTAWKQQLPVKIMVVLLFAVGSITPALQLYKGAGALWSGIRPKQVPLEQQVEQGVMTLPYSWQYIGRPQSFFNQYLRRAENSQVPSGQLLY